MTELSLADKKILSIIEYNPRVTFKEIAKACHLSKDTIKYRINRLEKENIITGYTCYIDYNMIGKKSYKIYLKIIGTPKQKEEIREYLKTQKNTFAIFDSNGTWNLAIAVFMKNRTEYGNFETDILGKFGEKITERKFCEMMSAELFNKNLMSLNYSEKIKSFTLWNEEKKKELDNLDKKLIKLLHKNSRTSLVNLSEELKLSVDATKNRIKRLDNEKILSIYKTKINYEKLGFKHVKLFFYPRKFSREVEREVTEILKNNKNCINIIRTLGSWRLEAECLYEKQEELDSLISKLYESFNEIVFDIEVFPVMNEEILPSNELLLD